MLENWPYFWKEDAIYDFVCPSSKLIVPTECLLCYSYSNIYRSSGKPELWHWIFHSSNAWSFLRSHHDACVMKRKVEKKPKCDEKNDPLEQKMSHPNMVQWTCTLRGLLREVPVKNVLQSELLSFAMCMRNALEIRRCSKCTQCCDNDCQLFISHEKVVTYLFFCWNASIFVGFVNDWYFMLSLFKFLNKLSDIWIN